MSGSSGPRDDHHGPTLREREILERNEDGMTHGEIARELGIKATYVRQVVKAYRISDDEHRAWIASAIASNADFLRLIARTGGSFA